jgi:hypothetical protein
MARKCQALLIRVVDGHLIIRGVVRGWQLQPVIGLLPGAHLRMVEISPILPTEAVSSRIYLRVKD